MSKYDFEKQLDRLLKFFAEKGTDSLVPFNEIPSEFLSRDIHRMLNSLEYLNLVIPFSFDYKDGKGPVVFPNFYTVTPAGVHFASNSSFVENAKIKLKERRLFDFSYFTMGWNTVIAFLALVVAIIALFD
jgi:hypothetical protein